jgi:hypothetical protein
MVAAFSSLFVSKPVYETGARRVTLIGREAGRPSGQLEHNRVLQLRIGGGFESLSWLLECDTRP